MATSSITKNFIVEGKEQVEMFANAIEEAYQDSLKRSPAPDMTGVNLQGKDAQNFIRELMKKRQNGQ